MKALCIWEDIATGFPLPLIDMITEKYEYIESVEHLKKFPFFNEAHVPEVWNILGELGREATIVGDASEHSAPSYEYDVLTLSDFEDDDFQGRIDFISTQC